MMTSFLSGLMKRLSAKERKAAAGRGETRWVRSSADYWERRYKAGGNSGKGSYGELAKFKADVLNDFVRRNGVESVIEFGCGDGNQLLLARYPSYLGYDVSRSAIERCRRTFAGDSTKTFQTIDGYRGETADLSMSLDVIYHLVEDAIFEPYMQRLFDAGRKFAVVYSSNCDSVPNEAARHVRHRRFTDWVDKNRPLWTLEAHIANPYLWDDATGEGSPADFYFYRRGGRDNQKQLQNSSPLMGEVGGG